MSEYILENAGYRATFSTLGAELVSFVKKHKNANKNKEFIWQADPDIWKRHAPVLFPVVGKSKVPAGEDCPVMGQHGFARDREFRLIFASEEKLIFQLTEDEETMALFPYSFDLMICYTLKENALTVTWQVINSGEKPLPFSIGGHPAFIGKGDSLQKAALQFNFSETEDRSISYRLLNEKGHIIEKDHPLELNDRGQCPLSPDFFDQDALIIEGNQCHSVTLLEDWQPVVRVDFEAPLFGLWSAANKGVPFVCIEPWYGRTDADIFQGDFASREWAQTIKPKQLFGASYTMTFGR